MRHENDGEKRKEKRKRKIPSIVKLRIGHKKEKKGN